MGKKISSVIFIAMLWSGTLKASAGASFEEVRDVLKDLRLPSALSALEQKELKVYQQGLLPDYKPILDAQLSNDARRTLSDDHDYYPRIEKRIHANGICFAGIWKVSNPKSPYSGYFAAGRSGLFIGRVSVTTDKTRPGQSRTFGFAGKIFPTMAPHQVVKTANFFTVDYLLGSKRLYFTDTALSNSPSAFDSIFEIDTDFIKAAFSISKIFEKINKQPTFRPVTQIAELGNSGPIKSPRLIEVVASKGIPHIDSNDFREELDIANYPSDLRLDVLGGDDKEQMQKLATIELKQSFISYGCDRQLHFPHPSVK